MKTLRKAVTSLILICLVALAARLIFTWDQSRKIPPDALATAPFEQETGSIAHALVTGRGFSNPFLRDTGPTAWLTPVYPLLVAATFKIFGTFTLRSFFGLVLFNSICSTAVCIPLYRIGERISGIGVASAAAWLWALFPSAVMMPFEWIWDTSLAAFLATAVLLATLKLADSTATTWRNWIYYGLLWGFILMTNPSIGSLLPFLLAWAAWRAHQQSPTSLKGELSSRPEQHAQQAAQWPARRGGRDRSEIAASPQIAETQHTLTGANRDVSSAAKPTAALAIAILCCIPWTIRNYAVFHRLVPLRSNFPLELYIGNNENYGGTRVRWPPPITKEREIVRYLRLGETAFMDEEMRKAKAFIVSHPGKEVVLTWKRFIAFWAGISNPVYEFPNAELLVKVLIICAALTGIGALAGVIVLAVCRVPYAFPLAVYPIVFPCLYYITHTSIRYRHPIDPIVLLLTALAFTPLLGKRVPNSAPSRGAACLPQEAPLRCGMLNKRGLSFQQP